MLNTRITGATLTSWGRRQDKDVAHLVRASFTAPITDKLIEAIERAEVQTCFRFLRDESFMTRATFTVPDGLVQITGSIPGENGTPHKIAIKDVRPVKIQGRSPSDAEPASVVLGFQWEASDDDVLWLWHAEGQKALLTIKPQKVEQKQTEIGDRKVVEPINTAPPPAA